MSPSIQTAQDKTLAAIRSTGAEIVIESHDGQLWTTSLEIAARFGRTHKNVLRAIDNIGCTAEFSRLNFEPRDYIDERGKVQPCFNITRDGFSFLAMGFTGKYAARWKEGFIAAFNLMEQKVRRIADQKSDPVRLIAIREKCAAAGFMTDALIEVRETQGKVTKPHHFSNEHHLCNWVLTGSFDGVPDDSDLDAPTFRTLGAIRRRNAVLIYRRLSYTERKEALRIAFPLTATTVREVFHA